MADRYEHCAVCRRRTNPVRYRMRPNTDLWNVIHENNDNLIPFVPNAPICNQCYRQHRHMLNNHPANVAEEIQNIGNGDQVNDNEDQEIQNNGPHINNEAGIIPDPPVNQAVVVPNLIGENVNVSPASEHVCCVCGRVERHRIPPIIRSQAWNFRRIIIPLNNRMCPGHLAVDGTLTHDAILQLSDRSLNQIVNYQELAQYLGQCLHNSFDHFSYILHDSKPRINVLHSDSDCVCYTGLNIANFNDLCSRIHIAGMHEHTKVQAIALLLGKLRLGNSQNQLGHFFGYSQSQVSKLIEKAGDALETQFVPHYLGYNHITRDDYIQNHQNSMIRILHEILPGSAGVILDGTYFEIEKSSNYNIQKGTFNLHKHYNLVKFMVVCAPDGYILDVFGPTGSDYTHNDATILNTMLADVNGFRTFFHANDILVVDRGFRDSVRACHQLGFRIAMPPILRGRKQLTREEADHSRFVTKVRWVVESVNGRIKNVFAFFRHQIPNLYINNLGRFLKISCALFNKYFCAIYPDRPEQIQVAQYMVQRSREANDFQRRVVTLGLDRFTNRYVRTNVDMIQGFPQLTEQDLRDITVGVYQIGESPSYTAYHLTRTGNNQNDVVEYEIYVHQDFPDIILVRMQSRHVQNKIHNTLLAFQRGQNGINAITGYFCSCYMGKRFVGMCCHTAAVLWLLSYGIPNNAYRAPAANIANGLIDLRQPN